jgi:hypothetical protein
LLIPAVLAFGGLAAVPPVLGAGSTHPQTGAVRFAGAGAQATLTVVRPHTGSQAIGSVTVANRSRVSGRYALTASADGSRSLAERLRLVVTRIGDGATVFDGRLADVVRLDLGTLMPGGEPQTFVLRVSMPAGSAAAPGGLHLRVAFISVGEPVVPPRAPSFGPRVTGSSGASREGAVSRLAAEGVQ